jgi:IS5 family transposase
MQNWFALSDPAMEEALYEIASLRAFAHLSLGEAIPDEATILNFRHLLEANDLADDILKAVNAHLARKGLLLKRGSIVDATIIAAPSSTKNAEGKRDPEMHQTKKGNQWHFGMKAHIAVDAHSGLVYLTTTAANEADVEQIADLLHGKEQDVWADSGSEELRVAWPGTICSGTSQPDPATLPSCPRVGRSNGSRSKSTARPACARRSSIRSGSSSARRKGAGHPGRTPPAHMVCFMLTRDEDFVEQGASAQYRQQLQCRVATHEDRVEHHIGFAPVSNSCAVITCAVENARMRNVAA